MRLWSIHPRYLDAKGLVALWREALLARAVLRGETRGYRHHPQLDRFRATASSRSAIGVYLQGVHAEAAARGYAFDPTKVPRVRVVAPIDVTEGQIDYEWAWLTRKLAERSPALFERHRTAARPEVHPIFRVVPGPVEPWERAVLPTACAGRR